MTVGEHQFGPAIVTGLLLLMLVLQMTMKSISSLTRTIRARTIINLLLRDYTAVLQNTSLN